jgi:hypothetical protein
VLLSSWAAVACAPPDGVLVSFRNREAVGDGGAVKVHVDPSVYTDTFTEESLPGTLRLRVAPSDQTFDIVVEIDLPDGTTLLCTYPYGPGTTRIEIDLAHPDSKQCQGGPDGGSGPPGDAADTAGERPSDRGPSSACASYCAGMTATCPDAYMSEDDCLALCAAYAWDSGTPGDFGGNSLECRLSYLGLAMNAAAADRGGLCKAAGASGGRTCGDPCANYCASATRICPAVLEGIDCLRACPGGPDLPGPAISSGDTIDCRIYWVGRAAQDPSLCAAGAPNPPAGSPCHP